MARYIKRNNLYISLDSNPWTLVWLLLRQARTLNFSLPAQRLAIAWIPGWLLRPFRIVKLVATTFSGKGPTVEKEEVLVLDVIGQFAIRRRPAGYKVFDLRAQTVTVLFENNGPAPNAAAARLRRLVKLGEWGVAPRVVNEGSVSTRLGYIEQYINTPHRRPTHLDSDTFRNGVLPLITVLAQRGGGKSEQFADYLERQQSHALELLNRQEETAARGHIVEFVEEYAALMVERRPVKFRTIASHGDLTEKNLFVTRAGSIAIDWETFGYRSLLYDVQAHFLSILVRFGASSDVDNAQVMLALGLARESTLTNLSRACPFLAAEIERQRTYPSIYRKLFYLELVANRLRHFVEPVRSTRSAECRWRLEQILNYVEIFLVYEDFLRRIDHQP